MKGLYIHIPFCVRKCSYCDFYSLPNRQPAIADYLQAVLQEAQSNICHSDVTQYQKNLVLPPTTPDKQEKLLYRETGESRVRGDSNPSFQTLYIGGGTPSLLGSKNLNTLITDLNKTFTLPCHSERSEESSVV